MSPTENRHIVENDCRKEREKKIRDINSLEVFDTIDQVFVNAKES